MKIFSLTFHPPWWATALVIISSSLFAIAGYWQLGRAEEKRSLFEDYDRRESAQAIDYLPTNAEALKQRYRYISLSGHYDTVHQFLLDSIVHDGQAGYQVLTPLLTNRGAVLVNRGWLPAGKDRRALPNIDVSQKRRTIRARIDRFQRPGIRLVSELPTPQSWPRVLLFPTTEDLAGHLGYAVPNFQLLLDSQAADGYLRDWRPNIRGPETNLGYAIQWFSFLVAGVVIYLALNTKKKYD